MNNPENLDLAEIDGKYDLKELVALAKLNELLRSATNRGLAELMEVYTAQEIADALKLVELAKRFACGYDEVAIALRLRDYHNTQKAEYRDRHKKELNKKALVRMRARREKQKGGVVC